MAELNLDCSFWIHCGTSSSSLHASPLIPSLHGPGPDLLPSLTSQIFLQNSLSLSYSQAVRENTSAFGMLRIQESYFHARESFHWM